MAGDGKGRRMAAYGALKPDVEAAGGVPVSGPATSASCFTLRGGA